MCIRCGGNPSNPDMRGAIFYVDSSGISRVDQIDKTTGQKFFDKLIQEAISLNDKKETTL